MSHDGDCSTYDFSTNYDIKSKIGSGAFSDVWLCVKRDDGKEMAAKILKKNYGSSQVDAATLNAMSEVKTAKTVGNHPCLLTMIGAYNYKECGKIVLVTELMKKSLFDVIKDGGGCSLSRFRIKMYTYQMLEGLKYLHGNDFIHRDIKPENVLLRSNDKELKIGDFGTSCHVSEGQPHAEYVATRWYRSPECMLTRGWYGKKMDVWAVGCVMYEMVMGHAMFCGDDEFDQMEKVEWVLGRPSPRLLNRFRKNKSIVFERRYEALVGCGRTGGRRDLGCGLNAVYPPHMPAHDVLKDMIVYDPTRRLSAQSLLRKSYFFEAQNTSYQRKVVEFEKSLEHSGTTPAGATADELSGQKTWNVVKHNIETSINGQQRPNDHRVLHLHANPTKAKKNLHEDRSSEQFCKMGIPKTDKVNPHNQNNSCSGIDMKIGHPLEKQSTTCLISNRASTIKIRSYLSNRPPFR